MALLTLRKHAVLFLVALLGLIGLASWVVGWPQSTAAYKYTGPIEKIVIGNIGEFSIFNLIAKEQGYFAEYGLDAEIREFDAGPSAIAALVAGEVDVAVAADFVGVRNMFVNNDLRIITQVSKHQVFQVLARKESGITHPSDLKGKKIGVTNKSAGQFYLGRFLSFHDLAPEDIIAVDLPPSEMVKQIVSGEIDAAVIFDPHAYGIKKQMGTQVVEWSAQREQKTFAVSYAMNSFINTHHEVIERYIRALMRAEEFTKEHPEEAQVMLARLLKYDPAYLTHMWPHFDFTHGLDQELLLSMEDQARWVIGNKLTETTVVPNYLDYVYLDALEVVRPEVITIIR